MVSSRDVPTLADPALDSRGTAPKRLVDAERSASCLAGARNRPKGHRTFRLMVERCAGPRDFSVVLRLSPWARPIAAQAVSAAPWATARDGD